MPLRSRPRPHLATLLLLAAVTGAAPVVRHCPFRWSEIDLATYAACSAVPKAGDCRANVAACSATASCPLRARAAAQECGGACAESGARPAGNACAQIPTSPAGDACAEMPARPAGGARAIPPARDHRPGGDNAYCLDEPFMASAARTHLPATPAPLAIASILVTIEVPATVRPTVRTVEARPPTAPHVTRPPIRGPPLLLG